MEPGTSPKRGRRKTPPKRGRRQDRILMGNSIRINWSLLVFEVDI